MTPLWQQLGNMCPCAYDGRVSHQDYCEEGEGARLAGYPDSELRRVRRRIARRQFERTVLRVVDTREVPHG